MAKKDCNKCIHGRMKQDLSGHVCIEDKCFYEDNIEFIYVDGEYYPFPTWDMTEDPIQIPKAGKEESKPKDSTNE